MDTPTLAPKRENNRKPMTRRIIWRVIGGFIFLLVAYHIAVIQLYQAVESDNVSKAEWLMRFGIGPNLLYAYPHPELPLHAAIFRVNVAMVRVMLRHHADVNAGMPEFNLCPMDVVVAADLSSRSVQEKRHLLIIGQMLVDHHCDMNRHGCWNADYTPLLLALDNTYENLSLLNFLIEHGANVNEPSRGGFPLKMAARSGKIRAVKLLLAHGARINNMDADQHTALDDAIYRLRHNDDSDLENYLGEEYKTHPNRPVVDRPAVVAYLKAHGAKTGKELGVKAADLQ